MFNLGMKGGNAGAMGAAAQPATGGLFSGLSNGIEDLQKSMVGSPEDRNPFSQALQDMSGGRLGKYEGEMTDGEKQRRAFLAKIGQQQPQQAQFSPVQVAGSGAQNPLAAYIAQIMGNGGSA